MYYVVLETSTEYLAENPKDQTKITNFYYQIIDTKTLQTIKESTESKPSLLQSELLNKCKFIPVNYGIPNGLQVAVDKLDQNLNVTLNDSEFILCSMFSTWTLRVVLQRQAFDENVNLPGFLKHLKIFDLWREYGIWYNQFYEKDTTYPNTNNKNNLLYLFDSKENPDNVRLINCLTILGLTNLYQGQETITIQNKENNTVDDDNKCKISLDFLKNINTTISVLFKLYSKYSNIETRSYNILTHVYNSDLDIKAFEDQESNILYMTNLPIDTTLSELELWFTQHGIKPIGFWTFKNILDNLFNFNNSNQNPNIWKYNQFSYLEELNSIPGFVVFQNHEHAKEALTSLNGRSFLCNVPNTKQATIIEHIIELQPSSNRVFDLAREILTSFPQGKNKPRPGDWYCSSCGFLNFQRRIACFRCSLPLPSSLQKMKSEAFIRNNINSNNNNNTDNIIIVKNGSLNSNSFYNNNTNNNNKHTSKYDKNQNLCNLQNLAINDNNLNNNSNYKDNNKNPRISYMNTNSNGYHNIYSNIPFRAGDWKCPICDFHNFAKNIVCLRCGKSKKTITNSNPPINKTNIKNSNSYNIFDKS